MKVLNPARKLLIMFFIFHIYIILDIMNLIIIPGYRMGGGMSDLFDQ